MIIGSVTPLVGTYWDEGWHTYFGRDTFWSPPHLVLFGGVALVGVAVAMWTFLSYLQHKDLRATLRQGSLVLGLIGVIATFVSAPIDDFWHETFGWDSVLFSPPHTLGQGYSARIPAARKE